MSGFRRGGRETGHRTSRRGTAWAVLLVALALIASACGNDWREAPTAAVSSGGSGGSAGSGKHVKVDAPGVTDTEIRVGGVASITNPLGGQYDQAFVGVQAYFDKINKAGGIYGRQLVLLPPRDDKLSNNKSEIQDLLDTGGGVFAVLPIASLLFTGADLLVERRVPTFGWTINPEWQGSPKNPRDNLFGQAGSFLCFDCANPVIPWLAKRIHAHKIGLLAYTVDQSKECADGVEASLRKFGKAAHAKVVFSDKSLSFGVSDLRVQVSTMKRRGVDLVTTCMDNNGVVTVAKEMKKQNLKAVQYLPNSYDQSVMSEFGDLFEGSYARSDFTQFELPDDQKPKGLKDFLAAMDAEGVTPTENAMDGWLNAALFVEGLRKAGPHFDREKVIKAINKLTDFTADGILEGTNWTREHTQVSSDKETCVFLSKIEDGEFKTVLSKPGKPFVCIGIKPKQLSTRYTAG